MLVSQDKFAQCLEKIANRPRISVDIETTGLCSFSVRKQARIAGIAVFNGDESFYFPFGHTGGRNLTVEQLHILCGVISNSARVDNWNIKFDMLFLRHFMDKLPPVVDGMFGVYLYNENRPRGLKVCANDFLGVNSDKEEQELLHLLSSWGYSKEEMWRMPPDFVAPYAEADARLAWALIDFFMSKMPGHLVTLWEELNYLSNVVTEMEFEGIQVDRNILDHHEAEARLATFLLEKRIQEEYRGLNPSSPSAVAKRFGVPDAKEETLLLYRTKPGISDILEHRWWSKAVNTYYVPYRTEFLDSNDVIHPTFKITGTVSGRFSCADPNLQAIPKSVRADLKDKSKTVPNHEQKIKDLFVAREGSVFAELDFSQAEIRVAAHYTKEQSIIDALREGKDIHKIVADEMGVIRDVAKVINFATIYGAGAKRLSEQLEVPVAQAQKFLNKYNDSYPGYRRISRSAQEVASSRGSVEMWNRRRRHYNDRDSEPHTAFNQLIQGGVAQMVIRTMCKLHRQLPEFRMRLQIHDAFGAEVEEKRKRDIIEAARTIMQDQPQFIVPMPVDAKVGKSLGQMEKYAAK